MPCGTALAIILKEGTERMGEPERIEPGGPTICTPAMLKEPGTIGDAVPDTAML